MWKLAIFHNRDPFHKGFMSVWLKIQLHIIMILVFWSCHISWPVLFWHNQIIIFQIKATWIFQDLDYELECPLENWPTPIRIRLSFGYRSWRCNKNIKWKHRDKMLFKHFLLACIYSDIMIEKNDIAHLGQCCPIRAVLDWCWPNYGTIWAFVNVAVYLVIQQIQNKMEDL